MVVKNEAPNTHRHQTQVLPVYLKGVDIHKQFDRWLRQNGGMIEPFQSMLLPRSAGDYWKIDFLMSRQTASSKSAFVSVRMVIEVGALTHHLFQMPPRSLLNSFVIQCRVLVFACSCKHISGLARLTRLLNQELGWSIDVILLL